MNRVSTDVVKPHLRGSCLPRLRTVAAAGSLLDYWTDFGRLLTKLPWTHQPGRSGPTL